MNEEEFRKKAKEAGLDDEEIVEIIREHNESKFPLDYENYLDELNFTTVYSDPCYK